MSMDWGYSLFKQGDRFVKVESMDSEDSQYFPVLYYLILRTIPQDIFVIFFSFFLLGIF